MSTNRYSIIDITLKYYNQLSVMAYKISDEVIIKSWIEEASTRIVLFHYEMRLAEDGSLLATGHTRHVFVNREMHRAQLPEKYYPMFGIGA